MKETSTEMQSSIWSQKREACCKIFNLISLEQWLQTASGLHITTCLHLNSMAVNKSAWKVWVWGYLKASYGQWCSSYDRHVLMSVGSSWLHFRVHRRLNPASYSKLYTPVSVLPVRIYAHLHLCSPVIFTLGSVVDLNANQTTLFDSM